jgi:hypothetical protein
LCVIAAFVVKNKNFFRTTEMSYTEAGRAIGFALDQTFRDAVLTCSALGILKRLEHISVKKT